MGQAPRTMEEALQSLHPKLCAAADRLVSRAREKQIVADACFGPEAPETAREDVAGWSFILGTHRHDGIEHWHLSARMQPIGRGSKRLDWGVLGFMVGQIQEQSGHPTDSEPPEPLTPFETTHPNRAHHWAWHSDGSPLDPATEEQLRAILGGSAFGMTSKVRP
jgi:hypothetical protein